MQRVEIVVKGQINRDWSDWFDGFEITHSAGGSTLTGSIRDQVELRGILSRITDLGLDLVSVNTLPAPGASKEPLTRGGEDKANNDDLRQGGCHAI